MVKPNITFINFGYCELEGNWEKVTEETHSDVDIFTALEENATINLRIFDEKKISYYMKSGSRITIKDHVLMFNQEDFSKKG